MKASDYIVDELVKYGVTDTFGIPGGVILHLLYAMKRREPELSPHLNYHEQMAGFAACGYAQESGRLGVAYATRGPGIANMITCIVEAYQESLPVLFITAHSNCSNYLQSKMRFAVNQEFDVVRSAEGITKYAASIDSVNDVMLIFHKACENALSGRKGPVLLDFSSSLWEMELEKRFFTYEKKNEVKEEQFTFHQGILREIKDSLKNFQRPLILIGDGLRHASCAGQIYEAAEKLKIPIVSSRGAQDLLSGSPYYFGYIGSHGTRYSNFILSKADIIIAIGNRLAFPTNSASFSQIVLNAKIVWLDIDEKEFLREMPNAVTYKVDASILLDVLSVGKACQINNWTEWRNVCNQLRLKLADKDCPEPVLKLQNFIKKQSSSPIYVCDIGNHEFWFARAFETVRRSGTVLYSKSFGTLGVALGRAIGVFYASKKDVICVMGDQGFQYNLQELQYIAVWKLPIKIIVLNNHASGMIADHERKIFGEDVLHVNRETGYDTPDFKKIAEAYHIPYTTEEAAALEEEKKQLFYEIIICKDEALIPNLPKGNACQDMEPLIPRDQYENFNNL